MKLLARASAGLLLWAAGFSLLYAVHGIGCSRRWDAMPLAGGTLFSWALGIIWLFACCAGMVTIWWAWTRLSGFERKLATTTALAGFAGTVVTGLPIFLISTCL